MHPFGATTAGGGYAGLHHHHIPGHPYAGGPHHHVHPAMIGHLHHPVPIPVNGMPQ